MSKNTLKTDAVTVKTLPPTQSKELTTKEKSEFKAQEKIIEDNYESSFALAAALHTIKINKLYRAEYETFEVYMEKRWNYSRSYGQRLLKVNEVMTDLEKVPEAKSVYPGNEFQARIYDNLNTNQRHELLKKALAESEEKAPTTKQLIEWKEELFPEKCKAKTKASSETTTTSLTTPVNTALLKAFYKEAVPYYKICEDDEIEGEFVDAIKAFIDGMRPLLEPEVVEEVA